MECLLQDQQEQGKERRSPVADINYAGTYFSTMLPEFPPIVFTITDYFIDRERYQKVYSYVRTKQIWTFRISDDPPVPGLPQGRLT